MDSPINFSDRLISCIKQKNSCVVVGLDPRLDNIPQSIRSKMIEKHGNSKKAIVECILEFNKRVIDVVSYHAVAVKPQIAFYEQYGSQGIRALELTIRYAKKSNLLVIVDAKRNDIGSTARAYADAYIGEVPTLGETDIKSFYVDAITINPFLGSDGIVPFVQNVKRFGRGVFILVRTSNPSARDIQDIESGSEKVYEIVSRFVQKWGENTEGKCGYKPIGAVVGATYPEESVKIRKLIPRSFFLVPGYGKQGASARDVRPCFNDDGLGAIISSSRSIIYAYKNEKYSKNMSDIDFEDATELAISVMKDDINSVRVANL